MYLLKRETISGDVCLYLESYKEGKIKFLTTKGGWKDKLTGDCLFTTFNDLWNWLYDLQLFPAYHVTAIVDSNWDVVYFCQCHTANGVSWFNKFGTFDSENHRLAFTTKEEALAIINSLVKE